jgi:hypothetical protein
MSVFIQESEVLVRQVASFVASFLPTSDEAVDAITAFANAQLTDESPNSLSLAISAICDYSYDVLSQFPSISYDIEDEVLYAIENLSEKIADYDDISTAQQEVSDWVQNATGE